MGVQGGVVCLLLLFASVLLNVLLLLKNHHNSRVAGVDEEVSWSKEAAMEAESVAAINCSGHGRAYLDGVVVGEGGKPRCECNSCYTGHDCSQLSPTCPADADSGDPLFLEPFWMKHAASSAITVAGWHRMSYRYSDGNAFISVELENHIRKLHKLIGNAVVDGRHIIFGAGSTQIINAAILALSPENSTSPTASVVASTPFYPLYQLQTEFFKSIYFKWQGDTSLWKNKSDFNGPLVEFVTSPNNPDGKLKKQVLKGPFIKHIFDHAYYWPHFSAITSTADEDLMIFTLSKLTGHAGSRFGWAVIKDEMLYQRMSTFMSLNTMGVSRDTQLRALKLIKVILKNGGGRELFEFGYNKMSNRWKKLSKSLSPSKRFSLQKLDPQYCTYFQNIVGPSPAYAWVKCENKEDQNCAAVLKTAGIVGRMGTMFNAETNYVRLSLIKSEDDFNLLLQKIDALVSNNGGFSYI